jgi:hypothetical protein
MGLTIAAAFRFAVAFMAIRTGRAPMSGAEGFGGVMLRGRAWCEAIFAASPAPAAADCAELRFPLGNEPRLAQTSSRRGAT